MVESFQSVVSGRLDKVLSSKLDMSRNQIEHLIKKENVSVNNKKVSKTSYKSKIIKNDRPII